MEHPPIIHDHRTSRLLFQPQLVLGITYQGGPYAKSFVELIDLLARVVLAGERGPVVVVVADLVDFMRVWIRGDYWVAL